MAILTKFGLCVGRTIKIFRKYVRIRSYTIACFLISVVIFLVLAGPPLLHLFDVMVARPDLETLCLRVLNISRENHFPKIIHQTWKTHDIPEKWKENVASCRQLNPDYEYRIWSDADIVNFLSNHYPWFLESFYNYKYDISRADAIRYFMMYHYGGVYIDMDIKCHVPFDQITNDFPSSVEDILVETYPMGFTNSFLMSKSHTSFQQLMINHLDSSNKSYLTPHWTIMKSAGPCFVHRAYRWHPCKESIGSLSPNTASTIFSHQQDATWHNWDGVLMQIVDEYHPFLCRLGLMYVVCMTVIGLLYMHSHTSKTRRHIHSPSDNV